MDDPFPGGRHEGLNPDGASGKLPPLGPESQIEGRARDILGLKGLETRPDALAVRAEQLWRMDHFAANVPFTNPMFVPMGHSPDTRKLYEAVANVVRRHEALRTRLTVIEGRAIQIVEDWKSSGIALVDIQQSDLTEDRPGRTSPISEFTQIAMDLYTQDAFHCRAFRDESGNVTLGFLAHGFFSDAWSSQVLFREIRATYSALESRLDENLDPVLQYGDYALAQRRSLDKNLTSHLSYWHQKLGDAPAARLPFDRQGQEGRRGRSYFFIDQAVVAPLVAVSQANRVSLTLVLLAAYQLALARWSGQSDILSAAYTADRVRPEFQSTIGFLVANMPVRSRLEGAIGFKSFLRDLAKEFYDGYAHRELSCELYEAIFAPEKPFCATVFNFVPLQKNFFDSELHSVPSFDHTLIASTASKPAIYREIYLGLAQYPNGILGKLFYSADRFAPEGIEVFIQHFREVVQGIANDPDVTVGTLTRPAR